MGITRQVRAVRHPLRWAVIGMPWTATAMDPDGAWGSETNDLPPLNGAWMMMDNVMKPIYIYIYIYIYISIIIHILYYIYILYIYYIYIYYILYIYIIYNIYIYTICIYIIYIHNICDSPGTLFGFVWTKTSDWSFCSGGPAVPGLISLQELQSAFQSAFGGGTSTLIAWL